MWWHVLGIGSLPVIRRNAVYVFTRPHFEGTFCLHCHMVYFGGTVCRYFHSSTFLATRLHERKYILTIITSAWSFTQNLEVACYSQPSAPQSVKTQNTKIWTMLTMETCKFRDYFMLWQDMPQRSYVHFAVACLFSAMIYYCCKLLYLM